MEALDSFDISILRMLQTDNYQPQRDIGEQIGLSAAAVQRRIKRMTQLGYIVDNVAILNREHLGNLLTIIVEVSMEREKIKDVEETKASFKNCPAVQQCYYVTGQTDFVLILLVASMQEYELLTRDVFFGNPNIKNFKTFVAMDLVKIQTQIPL